MSDRLKEAEALLFGEVIACPDRGGYCSGHGTARHVPYLGWTCGGCWHSSGSDGEPLMFSEHRCPRLTWLPVVLGPILAGAFFAIIILAVAR